MRAPQGGQVNDTPSGRSSVAAGCAADRIDAIDALRGFALVGILFINITSMGGPIESERPAGPPALADPDWLVWVSSHLFVYGSMRGIFSMLFGASALLFLRDASRSRAMFVRRCFWLLCFGALNGTVLLWPGDILLIYALASPVILLALDAPPRRLVAGAIALLLLFWAWQYGLHATESGATADAPDAALVLAEEQAARLGGYLDNLRFMSAVSYDWTFTPHVVPWILDAAAFMLVGMALFRAGVLSGTASTALYRKFAVIGMGVGLPIRAWETLLAWNAGGEFPPVTTLTMQFGRLAVTLGWIGLFMLAWRLAPWRAVFEPLRALGRMAFTGYLLQSVLAALIFSGFGLGLWGRLDWPQMWGLVPVIMLLMAFGCMAWLRAFRMGPMERLWRWLTLGPARRRVIRAR
jgi:uncharacterized protein